jgi:hypothetical protein
VAEIIAFDPTRRNNARLVSDLEELLYLQADWTTLDCTYRTGRWWKDWEPDSLTRTDLVPKYSPDAPDGVNFCCMPWPDDHFDVAVIDPPYGYRGTVALESDEGYGLDEYMTPKDRDALIVDGALECARVASRYVIVKCMVQVVSGKRRDQPKIVTDALADKGLRLVDELYVLSGRKQPAGRRQVHARNTHSTALVFKA